MPGRRGANRARCAGSGVVLGLSLLCGCAAPEPPAVVPEAGAPSPAAPAEVLFDGGDMDGWRTIHGRVVLEDGRMVIGRAGGKSTVLMHARPYRDGVLELDVRRRGAPADGGPYTFGLRIGGGLLSWRSVYVICRPGRVEACTGSATNWHPEPEAAADLDPTPGPERWRFEMDGADITCFRSGRRVLEYHDAKPREGGLAVTADRCVIEILSARYRPPATPQ